MARRCSNIARASNTHQHAVADVRGADPAEAMKKAAADAEDREEGAGGDVMVLAS